MISRIVFKLTLEHHKFKIKEIPLIKNKEIPFTLLNSLLFSGQYNGLCEAGRWEYTLESILVHHTIYTLTQTYNQFRITNLPAVMYSRGGKEL